MKNLYQKTVKNIEISLSSMLNALKKDFSFYNKHTEILAIWTLLFMTITGLFILAITSSPLVMFLLFILAVLIMFAGVFGATYYLYAIDYHNRERLLPRIHELLNKSYKLRSLLRFVRFPRFSILNNLAKSLKLAH